MSDIKIAKMTRPEFPVKLQRVGKHYIDQIGNI
jgi:hypothetical protein